MFTSNRSFPGITHITDAMGVSFTLIEGKYKAILFDTGYGMENVADYVKTLTGKPVTVFLSHGHHDHILGARWFHKTFLCAEDRKEFRQRCSRSQRESVFRQAIKLNIQPPDDYMTFRIRTPHLIRFSGRTGKFDSMHMDLGGVTASIIHVPGHTPGSIVLYIPEFSLLLTGDNWNPCTWIWFPSSLPVSAWRSNMISLIQTLESTDGSDIRFIFRSHQSDIIQGIEVKQYLAYMTDSRLDEAPAVDMGVPIDTHQVRNDENGWTLVFDKEKNN